MDSDSDHGHTNSSNSYDLINTPPEDSWSFRIAHEHLAYQFDVPQTCYGDLQQWKEQFSENLDTESTEPPLSRLELAARFLGFLASQQNALARGNSTTADAALEALVDAIEADFLSGSNIAWAAAQLPGSSSQRRLVVEAYETAKASNMAGHRHLDQPALFRSDRGTRSTNLFAVCGGQGNTLDYFGELRNLFDRHPNLLTPLLEAAQRTLCQLLTEASLTRSRLYRHGMDFLQWLRRPETTPEGPYLLSAPVSFPLIGLVQLANYAVVCHTLRKTPGEVCEFLKGWAGHSQGIVVASALATATTWESFDKALATALTLLCHIGAAAQEATPAVNVPSSISAEIVQHGEGQPSPMLNVSGCKRGQLQSYLLAVNGHLDPSQHLAIALVNGPSNFVIAGPVLSLCALAANLRRMKAAAGLDQSKVAFSLRKPEFSLGFLPISAPFHSSHLITAEVTVQAQVASLYLAPSDLRVPVLHSRTGEDLRHSSAANLVPHLVRMILCEQNNWPRSTDFGKGATHIIDFGPGGLSGVGSLLDRNKDGTGVRVLVACLERAASSSNMGFGSEIFAKTATFNEDWSQSYAPRLVRSQVGAPIRIDNKMTRLLGLPPVIVAGMTPTTVSWEFVSSIMNAGYHAELAGGGMHSAEQLSAAIRALNKVIPAGRGICVNIIYANPRQVRWQIPLLQQLRSEGAAIDGLTFGAGVPSVEVAKKYMELGFRYLSFKPGSAMAIKQVVSIAHSNPTLPILLQWTGGRGGGHHSFEDFHEPILKLYGRIRSCKNIVLLAGSGLGGADDAYPYLSGRWSVKQGRPLMPFDGVLLGSRVMVAKEAKTGYGAKQAIVTAPGVDEEASWEQSYDRPIGGVITVVSEMGEPIHKIATRGVMLWKDLDEQVFSIKDKPKRLEKLRGMKSSIIKRLNEDFQKVWFGLDANGNAVDLEDMTYAEVLQRLVSLLYVSKEQRWIDKSYVELTAAFALRVHSRFSRRTEPSTKFEMKFGLEQDPRAAVNEVIAKCPRTANRVIDFGDARFFELLCKRPGHKPPPFIPSMDDDFEMWFKKDSLWQSEDLAAVIDGDAGRTCILQGPVAAKYSATVDEPVGDILDGIHRSLIAAILKDTYDNMNGAVPLWLPIPSVDASEAVTGNPANYSVIQEGSATHFRIPSSIEDSALPATDQWLRALAGRDGTWLFALLTSVDIWQDSRVVASPIRRTLAPVQGLHVLVTTASNVNDTTIAIMDSNADTTRSPRLAPTFVIRMQNNKIVVTFFASETAVGVPLALDLHFTYHPEMTLHPIHEVMHGRRAALQRFYYQLWIGTGTQEPAQLLSANVARIPPNTRTNEAPDAKPMMALDTSPEMHAVARVGTGEPFTPRTPTDFQRPAFSTESPSDVVFHGRDVTISSKNIVDFIDSLQQPREVVTSSRTDKTMAPLDFAVVVGWESMMRAIFHDAISGEFLALVHLSNKFTILDDSAPLYDSDQISSRAEIRAIRNEAAGRVVEVCAVLERQDKPVLSIQSEFLFRGTYSDFDVCFEKKNEEHMYIDLNTAGKVAVLKSKSWFRLVDPTLDLTGLRVIFELQSMSRPSSATTLRNVQTFGQVFYKDSQVNTVRRVATVAYRSSGIELAGNPVMEYLQRHGSLVASVRPLANPLPLGEPEQMRLTAPASNASYARASGDFNPIHVSLPFARYANLPDTVTHGMYTSAAVRRRVEQAAGATETVRMRSYKASFVNMVHPGDTLEVQVTHVGLKQGQRMLSFQAINVATGQTVVDGEAEVDQPVSAYIFTGQGSQHANMGMELYESSQTAQSLWNEADQFFSNTYGFRLTEIVRQNPKRLTVHFGGRRGRDIRQNYLDLMLENSDGSRSPIFPHLNATSTSHTFQHGAGLLFSTEFVQPALTTLELAQFLHLKHNGITSPQALFAGHSLGEYIALSSLGGIMPFNELLTVVFFRGLAMQAAVERDAHGRSLFAMMAVNPSRIRKDMSTAELQHLVARVSAGTGDLTEIVNYNIVGQQYVVAGTLRALSCLGAVTDYIATESPQKDIQDTEIDLIIAAKASGDSPTNLERGMATIPLEGVDVPFHSSLLLPKMPAFRRVLERSITPNSIDAGLLVGKYISNVTGKVFDISPDAVREAYEITKSTVLKDLLGAIER